MKFSDLQLNKEIKLLLRAVPQELPIVLQISLDRHTLKEYTYMIKKSCS